MLFKVVSFTVKIWDGMVSIEKLFYKLGDDIHSS